MKREYRVFWLCPDCIDAVDDAEYLIETATDKCSICESEKDADTESKPRHILRSKKWFWFQARNVELVEIHYTGDRIFTFEYGTPNLY